MSSQKLGPSIVVMYISVVSASEMARKVAEMKMRKKAEKEQQREMLQRARQLRGSRLLFSVIN